jgi:hypothetical protein
MYNHLQAKQGEIYAYLWLICGICVLKACPKHDTLPPNQRMNLTFLWYNKSMFRGRECHKSSDVRPLDPQGRLSAVPLGR